MSCDTFAYGCNGGMISQVIEFLEEEAILSNECVGGYHNVSLDYCPETCVNGAQPRDLIKC